MCPKVLTDEDKMMWRNPACLSAILDGSGQGRVSEYRGKQLRLHKGNINNNTGNPLPSKIQQMI